MRKFETYKIVLLFSFCVVSLSTFGETNKRLKGTQPLINMQASGIPTADCQWHFSGHIGNYIDLISENRIKNTESWNEIYPETEDAFRLRIDDQNYPKNGVWRGEFWGKYMLSVIAACRYYQSDELKDRIAVSVKGLLSTQDKDGYVGTYKHSDFVIGDNWNVWDQKYTLWGLVEAAELLKDPKIIHAAERFTDHLISEVGPNAVDMVKTGNFYGMPSSSILYPMVQLYKLTGNTKYLEYSEYIVKQWSLHPAGLPDILNNGLKGLPIHTWSSTVDPTNWAKGYELTSCVEGLLELYKVTNNQQYFNAVKNIHREMLKWERSPVGSVSFDDKYVGSAGLINTISEICDVVYWNRLSFDLFKLTGDEKYVDEIERSFYNSMLCAFNTTGDWGLRRLRMSHQHIPAHNHFLMNHQCCTDNLPRGLFQGAETALLGINGKVYLSLFSEGEGDISLTNNQKVHLKAVGDFIKTKSFHATLSMNEAENFDLMIRMPRWSKKTIVKINGIEIKNRSNNSWMSVKRNWKNADKIEIDFDFNLKWEKFDPSKFSDSFHNLSYFNSKWSKFGFITNGSNDKNNQRYNYQNTLTEKDALPAKPAVVFTYGPLVLARDIRISKSDVFSTIDNPELSKKTSAKLIDSPDGVWHTFLIDFGNGKSEKFCDFSSAGNTWNNSSLFNTWCILK